MGRKSTHAALIALSTIAALSAPAHAEGLLAERVQATFSTSRKGLPRHSVKLRGTVTERDELARFRPEDSGLQLRIGAFVAVAHTPGPEGNALRLKGKVWRLKTKVNGAVSKLRIDTRSGAMRLTVKNANASQLLAGGPAFAIVTLELGSALLQDAVVFDERRRRGAVQWKSLAKGSPLAPIPPDPGTVPIPAGTLPFTILASGEVSDVPQPGIIVAKTQQEWEALYDRAIITTPHQRPGVDFTQEMVIGVFTGLLAPTQTHEVEVVNISDSGSQLQVSWRSRIFCKPFVCPSIGLGGSDCPDFSAWQFVRVRRVLWDAIQYHAPPVYVDCP